VTGPDGGIFRPDLLAGRVALVTGGGTGIGLGIASCLAEAGAAVAIASRKPEHLEPAAAELRGRGARVSTVETNVREPEAVARMVERVAGGIREHERVVTAVVGRGDPVRALSDAARQRQVDVIVMATHGRSGVSAVWAGSVASRLVGTGVTPVLLIRIPSA